ncbi:hypothetical protein OK016_14940 [Vibrio chagasii]|nr:hypothetical protein [Vibrio chagasii]
MEALSAHFAAGLLAWRLDFGNTKALGTASKLNGLALPLTAAANS